MRVGLALSFCSVLAGMPGMVTTDTEGSSETGPMSSSGEGTTTTGGLATTTLETTTLETMGPETTTTPGETTVMTTEMDTSTTEAPPPVCPDHEATDACCCFTDDNGHQEVCPVTELCGVVEILCLDDEMAPECPSGMVEVADETELTCALTALANGANGVLRFKIDSKVDAGYWGQEWALYLQGNDTAYVRTYKYLDLSGTYEPLGLRMLNAMSSFGKCMSEDAATRIGCLRNAASGEISEQCLDSTDVRGI
jgi:hypothetical protein